MNFAFLVSFLASISTLLGASVLFIDYRDKNKLISKSLSFASGVMISVSILDLIPSAVLGLNKNLYLFSSFLLTLSFMSIGIILSLIINKYLPTDFEKVKDSKLYKIGIFSMLAIILHNIPEGIATFLTTNSNAKLGITLAIAIALHNIPEGISISVPLYFGTGSKRKAILYTFISGISEFFGSIIAYLFLKNIASDMFINLLYALIAGIMISLSIEELIPNANKYSEKTVVIKYILIGIAFMGIVHFIT